MISYTLFMDIWTLLVTTISSDVQNKMGHLGIFHLLRRIPTNILVVIFTYKLIQTILFLQHGLKTKSLEVQLSVKCSAEGNGYIHFQSETNIQLVGGTFEGEDLMYYDFDSFSDVNGTVHFSLRNTSNGDLEYYSFDGNSWNEQIVDANDSIGTSNSIVVDSLGNVHIVYYDSANTSLKIASNFSGAWLIEVIDNSSDVGSVSFSFLDPNDTIHIAYYDSSAQGVKYATKSMNGAIPGWALDTDNDGINDSLDDCPNDAGNSTLDQLGCPDFDGDGYSDSGDLFPSNPSEW